MDKVINSVEEAVSDIHDGAVIMLGGFGGAGLAQNLIEALAKLGTKDLTLICSSFTNYSAFKDAKQVRKLICSFPLLPFSGRAISPVETAARHGEIEVEMVPQGTMIERIRCGGAGIPAFYCPVSVGTLLEKGKEKRTIKGAKYVLEYALKADFTLIKGHKADRWGNLTYRMTSRNYNPIMAMAAKVTIAEVDEIVPLGQIEPEQVMTPGIFVHRVVQAQRKASVWNKIYSEREKSLQK
jgi:3-oxoadipate CoA-transferase, alpha subunit